MQNQLKNNAAWSRWTAFTQRHEKERMQWFVISFVFQAVFCLPLPAALVYYYGASSLCLGVTILLFFINLTAGFCGAGIRTILSLTVISLAINLLMLTFYVLR
ncbi:MAG TPA: hypothetical protein VNW51_07405 [Mucilaginibacter sp.]|jgi:hypothetical protein|nr:hypothetical protein [Mucilaginibacter sp.]